MATHTAIHAMKPQTVTQRSQLANLPNLGPVTLQWLDNIGVRTRRDLQELGAINAYQLLRSHGYRVSLNLVYAIEGALRDCDWRRLPAPVRIALRDAMQDAAKPRCAWPGRDALMLQYHDNEWGVPVHDDTRHFEFLILEGAQAGLSWRTILNKRENYRRAFAGFDPGRVARFDARKVRMLMQDAGIVRNKLKIGSAISNARAFLAVQREFGSFDEYIWRFVGGRPIVNRWKTIAELPARTTESDALSADLKQRGFRFVGSTVIYAHMQAAGLVNDHLTSCYRYRELRKAK